MTLGEKILLLRKKRGISQEKLGELVGVTRQTISNWELGITFPNPEQLKCLSKSFETSIDCLVENDFKSVYEDKSDVIINKSGEVLNIMKKVGIVIMIIFFFYIVITLSILFFSNYFQTTATGGGVGTLCNYKGEKIEIYVWKDYQSNNLFLDTQNQEILNKFKAFDYTNEQKMINDIIKYIEDNSGECNLFD